MFEAGSCRSGLSLIPALNQDGRGGEPNYGSRTICLVNSGSPRELSWWKFKRRSKPSRE